MSDSSPQPLFMNENPAAVPVPRAFQQAYLWLIAGLGGSAMLGLVVVGIATQSSAHAERIAGAQGQPGIHGLVGALAIAQGRPGHH